MAGLGGEMLDSRRLEGDTMGSGKVGNLKVKVSRLHNFLKCQSWV